MDIFNKEFLLFLNQPPTKMDCIGIEFSILERLYPAIFMLNEGLGIEYSSPMLKDKLPICAQGFDVSSILIKPRFANRPDFEDLKNLSEDIVEISFEGSPSMRFQGIFQFSPANNQLMFFGQPSPSVPVKVENAMPQIPAAGPNILDESFWEFPDPKLDLIGQSRMVELILEHLPADFAVFNADFRFLFINRKAIKNDELRKWLIGKTEIDYWLKKKLPLDKALKRLETFRSAVESREIKLVEEIFFPGTPDEKVMLRTIYPHFDGDRLLYLLTYGVEITEQKKSRDLLIEKNEQLEKLNIELDKFIYSTTHNLRSPLTGIMGVVELMQSMPMEKADMLNFLQHIKASAGRMDETIQDIISFAKNARTGVVDSTVDLLAMANEIWEDVRFFENNNVEFSLESHGDGLLVSDQKKLKSVLHNLISNSLKYSDKSKSKSWIRVLIKTSGAGAEISVTDNGIGIEPEKLDKVFEIFYRGTSKVSGSGLGLYIVKDVVTKLGGSVSLMSEPGIETVFSMWIPNGEKA